jgi:hypothetical protein
MPSLTDIAELKSLPVAMNVFIILPLYQFAFWPSDTDGVISGNRVVCIAVYVFCTGNFALFQPILAAVRAKICEESAGSC